MLRKGVMLAMSSVALTFGCMPEIGVTPESETQEIIANLQMAGFLSDEIDVVNGVVYVGRDVVVSLTASREMISNDDIGKEHYRTNNTISSHSMIMCIDGSGLTASYREALIHAVLNYDSLPLRYQFRLGAGPLVCSHTIHAVMQPGQEGQSGTPWGGAPFPTIRIGDSIVGGIDAIEHVITHEIGHAIGLRHSDYFNRSISCGEGGNEGDDGIGAVHIPGTPLGAQLEGSIMNSCLPAVATGEFTSTDIVALTTLYPARPACNAHSDCTQVCANDGWCEGCCANSECECSGRPRRGPRGPECL